MMRRSTRLVAAANQKASTRMSTLISKRAERLRKKVADSEEEWKPGNSDGDYGEEDDDIEDGEEEEEEAEDEEGSDSASSEESKPVKRRSQPLAKKRKIMELSDSDSSDHDETLTLRPAIVPKTARMSRENTTKFKSILKKSSKYVPPQEKKGVEELAGAPKVTGVLLKGPEKEEVTETHRRPTQQRGTRQPLGRASSTTVSSAKISSSTNTMSLFFDEILEWNFYESLMREAQNDYVFSEANDGSEEGEVEIAKVPSQFESYDHYFSVWKPLALEEVQAQTLNNIFTDHPSPIPITASGYGTAFLSTKSCKIRVDLRKRSGPITHNSFKDQLDSIFVNDLVLITPSCEYFKKALANSKATPTLNSTKGLGSTSNQHSAEDREPTRDTTLLGILGIVLTQRASREGLTVMTLTSQWRKIDQDQELYLFKLNNLVTSVREFRALCDCRDYKLMALLLSGQYVQGSMQLDSLGIGFGRWLTKSFNESQLEAIAAAATSEGFTLIKGPPGTGKTTTLKGLLNSLHLREYSRYYNAVLDVARRPDNETNQAWAAIGNEKPHILVTAPSNAAVDNIVGKIIDEGFCDGEGRRYFPKIVRVGRGLSSNVRSVGLDDMVDQICSQPLEVLENRIISLRGELFRVERDSVGLRDHLRNIVAWIDRDPVGILAMQAQQQQKQETVQQTPVPPPPASTESLLPPPPHSAASERPTIPPISPVFLSTQVAESKFTWSSPSAGYPVSPPAPPSPSGSPSYHDVGMNQSNDHFGGRATDSNMYDEEYEQEEEEEDEAFPTSFGATSPALHQHVHSFDTIETSKAFHAFLDDDSSAEEDEPLPSGTSIEEPNKYSTEVHAEPDNMSSQFGQREAVDSEEDEPLPYGNLPLNEVDEPEVDEPLPTLSPKSENYNGKENESMGTQPHGQSSVVIPSTVENEPLPVPPSPPPQPLSPPPPPPMSPPPPPPPLSPPILSAQDSRDNDSLNQDRPSSPTIVPLSEPSPRRTGSEDEKSGIDNKEPIDYTRYHDYRLVAQQLNCCLEKFSELKLELQRYDFARKVVTEKGKYSHEVRQSLEGSFLDTAHIVFTTLSSAGVAALDASTKYDVLVVDEAAQAVELSTIIPMKFGSRQCVLVGDPQQLSATVFSRTSGQSLYERSLFERLETCGHPVHMLRTQYRSHPMISEFPRHYFYEGKLQDGDNVKGEAYLKPYHGLGPAFKPLIFWNLLSSRESSNRSVSRSNAGEADLSVNLYLTLKKSCPPDAIAGKVGMITPYSQQLEELRRRFKRALGDRYEQEVEINTVDGFQGREKDIIILSTVRADPKAGVGFLNDIRRMNVALTRAKFACYVIGSEPTLRSSKPWSALLDHSKDKGCIVNVENPICNLLTLHPAPPRSQEPSSFPETRPFRSTAPSRFPHGQWQPPHDSGPQPVFPVPMGSGWRGRGRGGDAIRGGRRAGANRGGQRNHGRGRGPGNGGSIPPFQQANNGPSRWPNSSQRGDRGHYPNTNMPQLQRGGAFSMSGRGRGAPLNSGILGPHGHIHGRCGPPQEAMHAPHPLMNAVPGRGMGSGKARDPRHRPQFNPGRGLNGGPGGGAIG